MIKKIETKKIVEQVLAKGVKKTKSKKTKKKQTKIHSNKIKAILDEIGMSQQELADLSELSKEHISRIVAGKTNRLALPTAIKISDVLNREVKDVFQVDKDAK